MVRNQQGDSLVIHEAALPVQTRTCSSDRWIVHAGPLDVPSSAMIAAGDGAAIIWLFILVSRLRSIGDECCGFSRPFRFMLSF
jgi:hypothetical protein